MIICENASFVGAGNAAAGVYMLASRLRGFSKINPANGCKCIAIVGAAFLPETTGE